MDKKCPKCDSANIKLVDYLGIKAVKCNDCGFDETEQYEVFPDEKVSQKEKGRYSPYKKGGKGRTKK